MSDKIRQEISANHGMNFVERTINGIFRSRPMAVALIGLIILLFTIAFPLTRELEGSLRAGLVGLGAALILLGASVELLTYLQSTRQSAGYSISSLNKIIQDASGTALSDLRAVKKDIESLKSNQSSAGFSKEEKSAIAASVTEKLTQDITDRLAYTWENKFKQAASTAENVREISNTASDMKMRLRQEVDTLSKRANVNLTFGVMISLVGIVILSYFIYITTTELSNGLNTMDIFIRFAIRFSLVAFIQIFAYFFLRLYRYSIFETKYFQNEITNIDARFLALQTALFTEDKLLLSALAKELTKTPFHNGVSGLAFG